MKQSTMIMIAIIFTCGAFLVIDFENPSQERTNKEALSTSVENEDEVALDANPTVELPEVPKTKIMS